MRTKWLLMAVTAVGLFAGTAPADLLPGEVADVEGIITDAEYVVAAANDILNEPGQDPVNLMRAEEIRALALEQIELAEDILEEG